MRLIVITSGKTVANETEIVNNLFRNGLKRLHIRKPLFDETAYREYINAIDPQYHAHIVIHGHYNLYEELHLGGIHLNSMAREDQDIWQTIKDIPSSVISTSFHSWEEIIENGFQYGYVFISPVFDSISKAGYKGSIQLEGIKATKHTLTETGKYCPEIIGLGGVDKQTLPVLQKQGFDGAALLGAIWHSPGPSAAYNEIAAFMQ